MTRSQSLWWCVVVLPAAWSLFAAVRAADDIPRQPPEQLGESPEWKLPALYDPTGEALRRILEDSGRWEVLPRPISGLWADPARPPCFEITHSRSHYGRRDDVTRWTAEQVWDGQFRLLCHVQVQAWQDDAFWIAAAGSSVSADLLAGGRWLKTQWISQNGCARDLQKHMYLARDAEGTWWTAGWDGLYQLRSGKWELAELDVWPGGPADGLAGGPDGSIVAWTRKVDARGKTTVVRLDKGVWSAVAVHRRDLWTRAFFRPDGSVVLIGPSQLTVLPKWPPASIGGVSTEIGLPENEQQQMQLARRLQSAPAAERIVLAARLLQAPFDPAPTADKLPSESTRATLAREVAKTLEKLEHLSASLAEGNRQERDLAWKEFAGEKSELDAMLAELAARRGPGNVMHHLYQGRFPLGEGKWVTPSGAVAVTPQGNLLVEVKDPSGEQTSLLVLDAENRPLRLRQWDGSYVQAAPYRDGRFLLLCQRHGLFTWSVEKDELVRLAEADEFNSHDRLLGADCKGRIYFRRESAIRMLTPGARGDKPIEPLVIRRLAHSGVEYTAVDSNGTVWFVDHDHSRLMSWREGMAIPRLWSSLPEGIRSIHAGRDGSVLVQFSLPMVALIRGEEVLVADSLLALAEKHFSAVLDAAPRATRGRRRLEPDVKRDEFPWLATGDCLWLAGAEDVYRLAGPESRLNVGDLIEALGLPRARYRLMGPLASGHLVLAGGKKDMTSWFWVDDPGGRLHLRSMASPPARHGTSSLLKPADFTGRWHLDANGGLWLHHGFDRVFCVNAPGRWPMLFKFAPPEFEHPSGHVWALHTRDNFAGYRIGGQGSSTTPCCGATYINHLTPLFAVDDQTVFCLSPGGLAYLEMEPERPQEARLTEERVVRWKGEPVAFVGRSGRSAVFVVNYPQMPNWSPCRRGPVTLPRFRSKGTQNDRHAPQNHRGRLAGPDSNRRRRQPSGRRAAPAGRRDGRRDHRDASGQDRVAQAAGPREKGLLRLRPKTGDRYKTPRTVQQQ